MLYNYIYITIIIYNNYIFVLLHISEPFYTTTPGDYNLVFVIVSVVFLQESSPPSVFSTMIKVLKENIIWFIVSD